MIVKLLTEHHLVFLTLKGGCTGSSESILVKMPHCWKSHAAAHISFTDDKTIEDGDIGEDEKDEGKEEDGEGHDNKDRKKRKRDKHRDQSSKRRRSKEDNKDKVCISKHPDNFLSETF